MKKFFLIFILLASSTTPTFACPFCNEKIMEGIYDSQFYPNLFAMLSAFIVVAIIVAILTAITSKRHQIKVAAGRGQPTLSPVPLTTTSIIIGIGLGGFIDGIVLHQILQTHEMLSNKIAATDYLGKSVNMFWDGIFHFFCLIVVLIGVVLLWKLLQRKDINHSGKLFSGGLLAGWGLFNIVEGVIDHHILKLHNVIELAKNPSVGNWCFLSVSVLLLIIGYVLIRQGSRTSNAR